MITIEEKKQKRIPGESSLFVSFDYNPDIVSVIKTCTPCNYTKKDKIWEIPCTRLAKFVNGVYKLDDIQLKLLKTKKEKFIEYPLSEYKTKPYPYQLEGIQYGLNHSKWLLLDCPGLGKTLQMIYLAEELKKRDNIKHCLIICGVNTLKSNWEKEIKKHSKLDCVIIGKKVSSKGNISFGSISSRISQLSSPIKEFFVILNIESIRDEKLVKTLKNGRNQFDMIVLDEAHVCKSNTSQQGKNLLKLDAKYKIALTGTLLLNDPLDAYMPLKWIGKENASLTNFRYQYCNYGGPFGNDFLGYKNIDVLKEQLNSCSLRRTKDLLDLPEKTIINEILDMDPRHEKFYNDIKQGIIDEVDKVKLRTANLLAMMARLRQATVCPSILTTENIPPTKLNRCKELVEEIVSNGNKVVVFSTFKQSINDLAEMLKDYNPLLCHGDISDAIISNNIDRFQTEDDYKVMLCTHQKMGVGITLTAASYGIFLDSPWTAGQKQQAEDRIHRIGSSKPVFIYNLICSNTVDERVQELVDKKEILSDYVIDDKFDEKSLDILRKYILELK